LLSQIPDLDYRLAKLTHDAEEQHKLNTSVDDAMNDYDSKFNPVGSALSMSSQLLAGKLRFNVMKFIESIKVSRDRVQKQKIEAEKL
jgi:hypothetical protein